MKKAIIITSAIEVNNANKWLNGEERSAFNAEQRAIQTWYTITSIDTLFDQDTTIFLLDTSDNVYNNGFEYLPNLEYILVKEHFPSIINDVRTNPNKSYCEAVIMSELISSRLDVLKNYDFIFKISGRYFLDKTCKLDILTEENKDKFLFKSPWAFNKVEIEYDKFFTEKVINDSTTQDGLILQYPSVLLGVGKYKLESLLNIYSQIKQITLTDAGKWFQSENLMYFLTRDHKEQIVELPWLIYGIGTNGGRWLRY